MEWTARITMDPGVLGGKPVVRGTRISVAHVVDLLSQDWSVQRILENYPQLAQEDIQACLAYAGALLEGERVFPLAQ
jgi:uncharacterized protein (DUF433 family)